MKEIKDRILRTEKLDWRILKPFQPKNLKIMTQDSFNILKASIVKKDFVASFKVWQNGTDYFILDGHHRQYALQDLEKDGFAIPEKFNCEIIDCDSFQQANELLLTYSSSHAKIDELGFSEFIAANNMDFDDLKATLELPGVNFERMMGDGWESDIDLSAKHGENLEGIVGKVTIKCSQENVDRIKEDIQQLIQVKGYSDASVS